MPPLARSISNGSTKSTKSTKSLGSLRSSISSSSSSRSSNSSNKRVSFGPLELQSIDLIEDECFQDVYYSGIELKEIRKQEVCDIRAAIKELGHSDFEDVEGYTLTWRGIEDFKNGVNKVAKAKYHTTEVLKEWKRQTAGGFVDASALRVVSKHLSRDDKQNALKLASKDAEFAGHKSKAFRRSSIRKTLNSALNLLQLQRPRTLGNTAA